MTFSEIIDTFERRGIDVSTLCEGSLSHLSKDFGTIKRVQKPTLNYEEKYQGDIDEGYYIHHFVDHDIYLKTYVEVNSYGDTTYPRGYGRVVTPQPKTVMVYD